MLLGWGPGRQKIPHVEYLARRAVEFSDGCGNIAPYMGNQVGFLGAILRLTNVPGVLAWDCLATDWFHEAAWPTTLVYNPHAVSHTVDLELLAGEVFIEAATGRRAQVRRVSDHRASVVVAADTAHVLVAVPEAASTVRLPDGRVTADGRVVAYLSDGLKSETSLRSK